MNAIHVAAFMIVLSASMHIVSNTLGLGIVYPDQNLDEEIEGYVNESTYPYSTLETGERSDSLAQGDFIGGLFNLVTFGTVGAVFPGAIILQFFGCGSFCGAEIILMATIFTAIVWFIYGIAIMQFISGRSFKTME